MQEEEFARISVSETDDVVVLKFKDEQVVDEDHIRELGEELKRLVTERPGIKLVVNFEGVKLLASAALGKFITLKKRVSEVQGSMLLCCLGEEIKENLEITRLDTYFDTCETEQEAIERLKGQ